MSEGTGRLWVSWVLMFIAGATDAVGFILFAGLYVSFMSGDATQSGVAIGRWDVANVVKFFGAQILFIGGAAVGQVVQNVFRRQRRVVLLAGVFVLLVVAALLPSGDTTVGMTGTAVISFVCAVVAMGAQNSVMHQESGTPVGTMITGTLVRLGQAIVEALAGRKAPVRDNLGQWVFFILGAAAGTGLFALLHAVAFLLPAAAALVLGIISLVRVNMTVRTGEHEVTNAS